MSSPEVFLYGSVGCHLCEQAEALLRQLLGHSFEAVQQVDVSDSDALMDRYGLRIPVLAGRAVDGEWLELGWPFDAAALRVFFARIEP